MTAAEVTNAVTVTSPTAVHSTVLAVRSHRKIASTTTTMAAFMPMFAITGVMGAFIAVIPVVVTASLAGSLWEAFSVLPSHAAELLRYDPDKRRPARIDWRALRERYAGMLRWSLGNRYFVSLLATAVFDDPVEAGVVWRFSFADPGERADIAPPG